MLYKCILWLGEDIEKSLSAKRVQRGDNWETANNLRNEPVGAQVLRGNVFHKVVPIQLRIFVLCCVSYHICVEALRNLALNPLKGASADEEDI